MAGTREDTKSRDGQKSPGDPFEMSGKRGKSGLCGRPPSDCGPDRERSRDDLSSKNKASFNRDSDWCGPDYIGD